jgi:hypothetical protein
VVIEYISIASFKNFSYPFNISLKNIKLMKNSTWFII